MGYARAEEFSSQVIASLRKSIERAQALGIGKRAARSGANCHNFAQYLLGFSDSIHYTSSEEMEFLFRSPAFCREVSEDQANVSAIFDESDGALMHSYVSLGPLTNEKHKGGKFEVFSKTSFWKEFPFERLNYELMAKWFRPQGLCPTCRNITRHFFCSVPRAQLMSRRELVERIFAFERRFQVFSMDIAPAEGDSAPFVAMKKDLEVLMSEWSAADDGSEAGKWIRLKLDSLKQNLERWIFPDEED